MGFLDRFKTGGSGSAVRAFEQEMLQMNRELLGLYLARLGIGFEQLPPLDRQILTVYLFGLVAAVNVEEKRGFGPKEMGEVVINVLKDTFHLPKKTAQVSAHDIVEQTKTRDQANPIYGILVRGEEIWPVWHSGRKEKVAQDMWDVVKMMHDIQEHLSVDPNSGKPNQVTFRYHPNLYKGDDVTYGEGVCRCCGKTVDSYVAGPYHGKQADCVCLNCVSSGRAAQELGGEFIQDVDEAVSDPERTEELLHRTPGYKSWQGEHWLTCCDDYCAYLGRVGSDELDLLEDGDEACREYEQREDSICKDVRGLLSKEGPMSGYLFQCLHCGKHHLWVDMK